jgi:CBS domain-containing protein
MPVSDYCRSDPATATPDESVQEAAKRMEAANAGCLVVVDAERRPVGLLTDRDVALGVLRGRLDPTTARVSELMHEPVVTVTEHAPLQVAARFMRQNALRRVPVVDNASGELRGIVAADDLVQLIASELGLVADVARHQSPANLRGDRALAPQSEG